MQVQWFPGHMHRARKQIQENLKRVDILWEIRDARAPLASGNPIFTSLSPGKPRVIIMNKSDTADGLITTLWQEHFACQNIKSFHVSAMRRNSLQGLIQYNHQIFKDKRWYQRRPIRVLILGIPNVGKSTLINTLAGKKKAPVANTPGFTKDILRYDCSNRIQIFDSPGVLWPKFEDQRVGLILSGLGAIRDSILPQEKIAQFLIEEMQKYYPEQLIQRYPLGEDSNYWLEEIGRQRGALLSGNKVDTLKAAFLFIKDLREGRLGKFTLEHPQRDVP